MKKLLSEKRRIVFRVMISYGYSLLAVVGTLFVTDRMLQDLFPGMALPQKAFWGITFWTALVMIAVGLQRHFLSFRGQGIFVPCFITVLIGGGWQLFFDGELLLGGLRLLANQYLTYVNSYFGLYWELHPVDEEGYFPALVFVYMLLISLSLSLRLEFRKPAFLALPPTLVLILELLVGKAPGMLAMGSFFLLMVLFYTGSVQGLSLKLLPTVSGLVLLILLFSGWIVGRNGEEVLAKADRICQFQADAEKFLKEFPIGQGLFGAAHLDNDKPEFENKRVLTVTSEAVPVGKLYLRESYADNYWRGYWTVNHRPLERAAKADKVDLEGLWEKLADSLYQRALQTGQTTTEFIVDCEQFGTDQMYLPYGAHWEAEGEFSLDENGEAVKNRLFSSRSFQAPISNDFDGSFGHNMCGFSSGSVTARTDDEELIWYSTYQQGHVTAFSEQPAAKRIADMFRTENIIVSENRKRFAYAQTVAGYLRSQYTYSLELEELPDGADAIEYFLSKGQKGYCMHFASAGVAILRFLGVPSRYVTGYVVSPSQFREKEEGYVAEVLDSQAHAWVEIYLDNIGWVPIEMTPGYEESSLGNTLEVVTGTEGNSAFSESNSESNQESEASENSDASEETSDARETEETEEIDRSQGDHDYEGVGDGTKNGAFGRDDDGTGNGTGDGTGDGENRGDGTRSTSADTIDKNSFAAFFGTVGRFFKKVGQILLILLKIVVAVGGVFLLAKGCRLLVRTIRRRRYIRRMRQIRSYLKRGRYNRAAVLVNRFLYQDRRRNVQLGKQPETDEMFREELKQRFPYIPAQDWDRYYEIIVRAFYGCDEIAKEEAEFVCQMLRE